ncbi:MAG: molecular chaperone DnaJ [Sphingomonadales bacterium]
MAKSDYYDVLNVGKNADEAELKRAYRKLAMQYHPDRNPDDAEAEHKFKEVGEAYDVLKDNDKRAAYDRFGHAAFDGSAGQAGGFGGGFSGGFGDIFDDLFGEFTGSRQRRSGMTRGADLRYDLEISLEDAYRGKKTTIKAPTTVSCEDCSGSGAAPGSAPATCRSCAGHGKVRTQQGFFTVERTCPSCRGNGRVISDPCRKCSGAGRIQKQKSLSVTIPAGVEDGTRIRLTGEGDAGEHRGPAGDLYIFLSVKAHRLFQRDGVNILCRVPISMVTAALGGQIEVPVIGGGRARINVPAGTQNGKQFRLRAKGMPALHGSGFGDMLVQTVVETPVNLTRGQKELLRQFGNAGKNTSPESEGFFAKVKELWADLKD